MLKRLIAILVSDPPDPVRILVCRAFTNAAVYKWGQEMLMLDNTIITKAITTQLLIAKPNLQVINTKMGMFYENISFL